MFYFIVLSSKQCPKDPALSTLIPSTEIKRQTLEERIPCLSTLTKKSGSLKLILLTVFELFPSRSPLLSPSLFKLSKYGVLRQA